MPFERLEGTSAIDPGDAPDTTPLVSTQGTTATPSATPAGAPEAPAVVPETIAKAEYDRVLGIARQAVDEVARQDAQRDRLDALRQADPTKWREVQGFLTGHALAPSAPPAAPAEPAALPELEEYERGTIDKILPALTKTLAETMTRQLRAELAPIRHQLSLTQAQREGEAIKTQYADRLRPEVVRSVAEDPAVEVVGREYAFRAHDYPQLHADLQVARQRVAQLEAEAKAERDRRQGLVSRIRPVNGLPRGSAPAPNDVHKTAGEIFMEIVNRR